MQYTGEVNRYQDVGTDHWDSYVITLYLDASKTLQIAQRDCSTLFNRSNDSNMAHVPEVRSIRIITLNLVNYKYLNA